MGGRYTGYVNSSILWDPLIKSLETSQHRNAGDLVGNFALSSVGRAAVSPRSTFPSPGLLLAAGAGGTSHSARAHPTTGSKNRCNWRAGLAGTVGSWCAAAKDCHHWVLDYLNSAWTGHTVFNRLRLSSSSQQQSSHPHLTK